MDTQVLMIAVAVIAVVLIAIGVWFFIRQKRSEKLRERFGPEYHHTVRTLKTETLRSRNYENAKNA
jgi:heme/copper-type cytochrome/quinol oxidase subunit 2